MAKYVEVSTESAEEIQAYSEQAAKLLLEENGIKVAPPEAVATIAFQFLRAAISNLSQQKEEGADVETNLFHLVELGITHTEVDGEKDGNFVPYANPGQEFKLMAKADGDTED